jgi:hypothetical protein
MQIQIQNTTHDMHIHFYTDKRHLIYNLSKRFALQHCTEISNTKDSFKRQQLLTYTLPKKKRNM